MHENEAWRVTLKRSVRGWLRARANLPKSANAVVPEARAERQRDRAIKQRDRAIKQRDRAVAKLSRVERKAGANALRWARTYQRILAILHDTTVEALGSPAPTAPIAADTLADRRLARRLVHWSTFAERLTKGATLEEAVADGVRSLVAAGENAAARSLSQSLKKSPGTRIAGHLGAAVSASMLGWHPLAYAEFDEVPPEVWRRLAADEYFRSAFAVDAAAGMAEAQKLADDQPSDVPIAAWLSIAMRTLVARDRDLARRLYAVAETRCDAMDGCEQDVAAKLSWLGRWLGPAAEGSCVQPPAGALSFAVLDYKLPEYAQASVNTGDHVQTIAALGHLTRHERVRFSSDVPGLDAFAADLQQRVDPNDRFDTVARDIHLVSVNRDASTLDDVPADTWAIWFGWHMKETCDGYDFPLHPNLRPIILSFHCQHVQMLTPAAVDYLKKYAPIGCRDWATVDILLSAGVPAFFSGCLTTTIDLVYPALAPENQRPADAPEVFVEVLGTPEGASTLTHTHYDIREASLPANLRSALDQLEVYRRDYSKVLTSRLHCHLPCRSLGVPTEFRPRNIGDLRYEGLIGISDEEFGGMRAGLRDKLAAVTTAIVEGRDEQEVYAVWREACAQDVAVAASRPRQVPSLPEPWFDVRAACRALRADAKTVERRSGVGSGDEVHVALALDVNLVEQLHVMVTALVENSSRPLHLWLLCRGIGSDVYRDFAAIFPEVSATWLTCDPIDYGTGVGLLKHTTASTMDRLLLPELLEDLTRVIYIDIDTLPVGDIALLHDWELDGAPLAARSAVGSSNVTSGLGNVVNVARDLQSDAETSRELVHRMFARFAFDFDAFNAGVLVLDLEQMRADDFCSEFLPYVARYGLNDQDVLNCYAGPRRAVLPAAWNAQPTKEPVHDPQLVHWTGSTKPWGDEPVGLQELWVRYEGLLEERRERSA